MTFSEFLEKIQVFEIKFTYREIYSPCHGTTLRMIRDEDGRCPICAVVARLTGVEYSNSAWCAAGESIGLDNKLMQEIVEAADDDVVNKRYTTPTYQVIRSLTNLASLDAHITNTGEE